MADTPNLFQFSLPGRDVDVRITMPNDLTEEELAELEALFRLIVRSQLRRLPSGANESVPAAPAAKEE